MNSTVSSAVQFVAQNVTEHLQEDEIQYFYVTFLLIAIILCLILSFDVLCIE